MYFCLRFIVSRCSFSNLLSQNDRFFKPFQSLTCCFALFLQFCLSVLHLLYSLVGFGYFFFAHHSYAFHEQLGPLPFLLLSAGHFIHLLAYPGVDSRAGDFFEYLCLFLVVAVQKSCELSLSQHCCPAELVEIKPHGGHYLVFYLFGLRKDDIFGNILQLPFLVLKIAFHFVARPRHRPPGLVLHSVAPGECQFHVCFSCIPAHQLAWVVDFHFLVAVHRFALHSRTVKSGRGGVQSQADGIKYSRFACSCLAADQEHLACRQRFCVKVYHRVFYRRYVVYREFL